MFRTWFHHTVETLQLGMTNEVVLSASRLAKFCKIARWLFEMANSKEVFLKRKLGLNTFVPWFSLH